MTTDNKFSGSFSVFVPGKPTTGPLLSEWMLRNSGNTPFPSITTPSFSAVELNVAAPSRNDEIRLSLDLPNSYELQPSALVNGSFSIIKTHS